jgi:hypothetical protein
MAPKQSKTVSPSAVASKRGRPASAPKAGAADDAKAKAKANSKCHSKLVKENVFDDFDTSPVNAEYYGKLKKAIDRIRSTHEFDGVVDSDGVPIQLQTEGDQCGHQSCFDQEEFEIAVDRTGLYCSGGVIPWGDFFKPAIGGVPVAEYQAPNSLFTI